MYLNKTQMALLCTKYLNKISMFVKCALEPPVNTSSARIVPDELSVGAEAQVDEGTWDSSESVTFSYQWQLGGVDIIGATSKSLLILAGMVGQALRCIVRCSNSAGFAISITTAVVITL